MMMVMMMMMPVIVARAVIDDDPRRVDLDHVRRMPDDHRGGWVHVHLDDRQLGAYPVVSLRASKYFPPVSRIDAAYGDRNLMCSCEPLEVLATQS